MSSTSLPNAALGHPAELPFDTIKARAQRTFVMALQAPSAHVGIGLEHDGATCLALLRFACLESDERDALREFVLSLAPPARNDSVSQRACEQAEFGRHHWSHLPMQVREAGPRRINRWDIGCIGSLIAVFRGCVSRSRRRAALDC